MQDEIIIELSKPVECHYKGGIVHCKEWVISAPNSKLQSLHMKIKSAFVRAIAKQAENQQSDASESKGESKEMKGSQFVMMIMMAGEDVSDLMDSFQALVLKKGMSFLAHKDHKVELTSTLYDELMINDVENALGEYIKVFIYPSIL